MFRAILLVLLVALATMNMMATIKVQKTEYKGWPNCYRVSSGETELIVTGDVGPRVIRFGFVGGKTCSRNFPSSSDGAERKSFNCVGATGFGRPPRIRWRPGRRINVLVSIRLTASGFVATEPGQMVEHVEHWGLYRNVMLREWSDEELDRVLLPLVQSVGSTH